ncbi:hypothetical protein SAMN05421854_108378 [Amycolatopsis rubida]|uniref:Uncharacterized protein n=1 Tax=Amycolatopsis rubida TaxID=112413 RepID=A0A1I5VJ19_9PSEU|nr:hypothetical protein SAMN05421854_108378 [Amycolatopsis rubida]
MSARTTWSPLTGRAWLVRLVVDHASLSRPVRALRRRRRSRGGRPTRSARPASAPLLSISRRGWLAARTARAPWPPDPPVGARRSRRKGHPPEGGSASRRGNSRSGSRAGPCPIDAGRPRRAPSNRGRESGSTITVWDERTSTWRRSPKPRSVSRAACKGQQAVAISWAPRSKVLIEPLICPATDARVPAHTVAGLDEDRIALPVGKPCGGAARHSRSRDADTHDRHLRPQMIEWRLCPGLDRGSPDLSDVRFQQPG